MSQAFLNALDKVESKFNDFSIKQRTLADRMLQIEQMVLSAHSLANTKNHRAWACVS